MESNKRILLSIVFVAIMVVLASGITFAFFNYTRTGLANNIRVGRIYFNTSQNGNISLTNVSPITSEELDSDQNNHDSVTITITGDTTYDEGVEYLVTFTDVNNTVNNKEIPIAFSIESTGVGTSSSDYYNDRGNDTSVYLLTEEGKIVDEKYILVGYIAPGQTGINGNITITAYVDADSIAVTNTYDTREPNYAYNPNMSQSEIDTCSAYLESRNWHVDSGETLESFCNGTGTNWGSTFQEALDNNWFSNTEFDYLVEHNIIVDTNIYTDLTTSEWVNGRKVFSTSEWNSLQGNNALSFKVKVEANEGIWVERESTPSKCFTFSAPMKTYVYNDNMTQNDIDSCISYFSSYYFPDDNDREEYCKGTGMQYGSTIQDNLDDNQFSSYELEALENANVIISLNEYHTSLTNYDNSCGSDVVIPRKIDVKVSSYVYNTNRSNEDINNCISYLESDWGPESDYEDSSNNIWQTVQTGETYQDFCAGTGTNYGDTFQEYIEKGYFNDNDIDYFREINIINEIQSTIPNVNVTAINGEYDSYYDDILGPFYNKGLTSVYIPSSIKKIGYMSFADNNISKLTMEDGISKIGYKAFYGNNITNLVLPNTLKVVDSYAFENNNITSLYLPNSIKEINDYAFRNNPLISLHVDMNDFYGEYTTNSSSYVICNRSFVARTIGVSSIENVTIGENVEKVSACAFYDIEISTIEFSDNVKAIGGGAFENSKLNSIDLPDGVTIIYEQAFKDNNLSSIDIPDSVIEIHDMAFAYNEITEAVIPQNVTTLENAFSNNPLTTLTLDMETIPGDSDFNRCRSIIGVLDSVTIQHLIIGEHVNTIEKCAFRDHTIPNLTIRNGVQLIDSNAFYNCQIQSLNIPNSVTTIGNNAFEGNRLTSVTIGSGIESIGEKAFDKYDRVSSGEIFSNYNLTSITIDKPCSVIKNMDNYPWTYNKNNLTLYGSNNEVCN